jgi:hypothetical protein
MTQALPPLLEALLRELSVLGDEPTVQWLRESLEELADAGLENEDAEKLELALSRVAGLPLALFDRLTALADILAQRGVATVTVTRDGYSIARPS